MGGGGGGDAAAVAFARLIVPPGGRVDCMWSSCARCACILLWSPPLTSTSSNLVSCGRFLSLVAILSGNCILSVGCVIVSLIISS